MKYSDTKLNAPVAALVRLLLWPKVYYLDSERKDELFSVPTVLVCNHTGHLDGPFVNTVLRKYPLHSLAAKDRFAQKGFGFFLRHTGCIPIDRENADTSWIHESLRVLREDREHIAIYPEGRHGGHRKMLPFHPGATMLIALSDAAVVEAYIDGPVKLFRRNKVIFSTPFHLAPPTAGMNSEYLLEQTRILQQKEEALKDEFVKMTKVTNK